MNRRLWLDRPRAWAVPLALLLAAAVALGAYQLAFADRVGALRSEVERERQELERLRGQRQQLEELVARAEQSRDGVRELYDLHFATESERFTTFLREVKQLAEQAGLRPTSLDYPDRELEDYELIERAVVFSVEGSYQELRRFVNFLELSDSFVILRSITVRGGGNELGLSLQLATLFTGRDAPPSDGAETPIQESGP
jgi:Tfp pilus assembly protein PilO